MGGWARGSRNGGMGDGHVAVGMEVWGMGMWQ